MITRFLIVVHRWLGVALCVVFLLWFPSGIGMRYWDYRPLWAIVVITFMVGGTALCVTSLILAWRVLGRKLTRLSGALDAGRPSEDLYNTLT